MSIRVTGNFASTLVASPSVVAVTQNFANFMGVSNSYRRRVTTVYAHIMGKYPLNTGEEEANGANRFSQVYANVMIPFTPNFEWIDMVIDEVFPFDISYNSIGATRFQTDVVRVDSGHDQRSSRWDQPLMEYDIAYGVRTMEHLQGLIAFFRAMRGRRDAFLYHDHVDYTSTLATDDEARRPPDTTHLDQQIGIGDHVKYKFQLVKKYPTPSGGSAQIRPIYRPQPNTVMIGVGGLKVENWEVDYTTGVITFTPNWQKLNLQGMRLEAHPTQVNMWVMSGAAGTFTGLIVGDKIITRNWLNPNNNSNEALSLVVINVSEDGSTLTYSAPAGYGELESNRNGVGVYRHPAPKPNLVITAGFYFYVPVRFDTDRLPVSLEEYGIGGAADVKLIEIRPSEVFDV